MCDDLLREDLVPLKDVARFYPGPRPHVGTVVRHALYGCGHVKLETLKRGGRRFSSAGAVRRFIKACTDAADSGQVEPAQKPTTTHGGHGPGLDRELSDQGL